MTVILLPGGNRGFSEVKVPDNPRAPTVSVKKNDLKLYPVRLDFSREKKIRGHLHLDREGIRIAGKEGEKARYIRISDIRTIDFLKWKGSEYRKNSYLFKPSKIKITRHDGSFFIINRNIASLNSLLFSESGRKERRRIYSVFYDYFRARRWISSGSREKNYPEDNPHRDALIRIEFLKVEKMNQLTEEILKLIKK